MLSELKQVQKTQIKGKDYSSLDVSFGIPGTRMNNLTSIWSHASSSSMLMIVQSVSALHIAWGMVEKLLPSLPLATDTPPLPMEYSYFPDHNVSPTIVIMKENIEEGGVSVAKGRDLQY